jgi:hypothetical protein
LFQVLEDVIGFGLRNEDAGSCFTFPCVYHLQDGSRLEAEDDCQGVSPHLFTLATGSSCSKRVSCKNLIIRFVVNTISSNFTIM